MFRLSTQLETATLLGPNSPVKAMIPACASGDFYRDTAFDNGIPTIVGSVLGGEGDLSYYRDYWKTRDRLARAQAIAAADIPMLLWSGWHEPGALGSLELYTAIQNLHFGRPATAPIRADTEVSGRYQVILGDWSHAMGLDMGFELQWFDTWIKGLDTGLPKDTRTPLHLAEQDGSDPDRWVSARCYPLTERYTPFYLASGGVLSEQPAAPGVEKTTLTWGEGSSDAIEYESEVLAGGAMLAGPMAAQLEASSSNTNLQLVLDVFDESADGQRLAISHGSILGSRRRKDDERSWSDESGLPVRPYLTLDQDEPLTPLQTTRLEVPLWPSVWSIEAGHRIVLKIAVQPDPDSCLNPLGVPAGCYPTEAMKSSLGGGVYSIHYGASLLSLPLLPRGSLPTAKAASSPTGNTDYPLPITW